MDERDMALQMLGSATASQGWQPIETAPQTGYMLVHEDGAIRALFRYEGEWEPTNYPALVSALWPQNVLVGQDAARVLDPLGFRLVVRDGCCEEPTHWMPIPDAPTVAQSSQAHSGDGSPASTVDGQMDNKGTGTPHD